MTTLGETETGKSGKESGAVDQAHLGAGHQLFDVHQDEHAVVDAGDAGDEAGVDGGSHLGGRLDRVARQFEHIADRVDDGADDTAAHVQHDHDGEAVVVVRIATELQAQVDDRDDHAAQVDHALDEGRGI